MLSLSNFDLREQPGPGCPQQLQDKLKHAIILFVITLYNCAECKSPISTYLWDDLKDDCVFKIVLTRKSAINLF